ncbi:MAG: hypothetical protein Q9164_001020 [Protoblastenia rupestris]
MLRTWISLVAHFEKLCAHYCEKLWPKRRHLRPSPEDYSVHLSKKSTLSPAYVSKYRALRLHALKESPSSFHSTYAHESTFTDHDWADIITDPNIHTLICVHGPTGPKPPQLPRTPSDFEDLVTKSDWIALARLHGPLAPTNYLFPTRTGPAINPPSQETLWYLIHLYIHPLHRGRGASIALHEAILTFLREYTNHNLPSLRDKKTGMQMRKFARVGGTLGVGNGALKRLYTGLGGYEVGWMTMSEALSTSGETKLADKELAKEEGRRKHRRKGERCIKVLEAVIAC